LRAIVRLSHEAGREQEDAAGTEVRAALDARPDSAELHAVQGLWLDLRGNPSGEIEAAYAKALELDPANASALAGLGRLALGRNPDEAVALFNRAVDADPGGVDARRGAAQALAASGRTSEAEKRLRGLLSEHPYDAGAAAALAQIQLDRGAASERTLELAQRAVRFGGGAEALDLLSRIHKARNEPESASEADARARALRGDQKSGAEPG
jgi:predicted Zn-dependent protease